MTVAVCLDDHNGRLFNNRRQSRDRILIDDFCQRAQGGKILISGYSESLFSEKDVQISESIFADAGENDFCFSEKEDLNEFADKITRLIIYRWNRDYPHDVVFDFDLSAFEKTEESEFEGSSHENITCDVYEKL